ncbi:AI-2E family transporter [Gemmobacter serpentinus]|uniref:AI-2E family transporter n=1 Tax=Gemmobacter serpentinus TaxID=2652247 RepID=UPI00124D2F5C|nr:AI-2E family transporter [Gemmobacter serpentinus]
MDESPRGDAPAVITAFAAAGLVALTVLALVLARDILIPLAFALIVAFILWALVDWMGRVPVLRRLPALARHVAVLAVFALVLVLAVTTLRNTVEKLRHDLPQYSANIDTLVTGLDQRFGLEAHLPGGLKRVVTTDIDLEGLARQALADAGSFGGLLVLTALYTTFLLLEYGGLQRKLQLAFPEGDRASRLMALGTEINRRIGGFLAVRTLINLALGVMSWLGLRWMGVEFAGFWAIFIAILGYTPYLGTVLGVGAPSLMALVQTGDLRHAVLTGAMLALMQFILGSLVEPRVMGRRINLSPLMVLISLAVWFALWGLPGAVLAVPMTVSILAALGAWPATRPVAILLSHDGRIGERGEK